MWNLFSGLKDKALIVMAVYCLCSTGVMSIAMKSCQNQKKDKERYEANTHALLTDLETFKTKDGENAAKLIQLELTNGEFEKLCSEQAKKIKDLNLKIKRLESVNVIGSETIGGGKTNIKDSVVIKYIDSVRYIDKVKTFEWSDEWTKINGVIEQDSVDLSYKSSDTLTMVAYRVPRKILGFIPCGTKYIEVQIVNANKNTVINYAKTIKVGKKKKLRKER